MMTRPGFLVVGAQRAGTTWLDGHLRAHPDVYLPERRKELHYFDANYDRGPDWYASFFPPPAEAAGFRAIGEITPKYLYDAVVPARIRRDLPECRLIAILRNPVDRAYSQYALAVRDDGERGSFDDFIARNPDALERGFYARQLARYFDLFPRERFLVLLFERVIRDPDPALARIASFLGVDATAFPEAASDMKVNASYRPRHPRLRAAVRKAGEFLRAHGLDWCVNVAKDLGVPHMFGNRGPLPPLDEETRRRLADLYDEDVEALERMLDEDLSRWRLPRGAPA
jgi:hypothetical protein